MRLNKKASKKYIINKCIEFIDVSMIDADHRLDYSILVYKLLTAKQPIRIINKLKKQYKSIYEILHNIDILYDYEFDDHTAIDIYEVTNDPLIWSNWSPRFSAIVITTNDDDVDWAKTLEWSDSFKLKVAEELISLKEKEELDGFRVAWRYVIKVIENLNSTETKMLAQSLTLNKII